jgi:antitoxin HicB
MSKTRKTKTNPHMGGTFDDFLREEGIYLTKVEMARRMRTSRVQLDRLLDPDNDSVTLATLCRAAAVVGRELRLELV